MGGMGAGTGGAGPIGDRSRTQNTQRNRRGEREGIDIVRQAVEQALTANGAAATTAATVAAEAVAWLQKHAGSQRLWISSARTTVHDSIRAEYTGRNLDELAERYGVHARTVRRIVCTSSRSNGSTLSERQIKSTVLCQNDATEK